MTNLPVFFTSAAARVAKESMILEQTPLFSSCSSASAPRSLILHLSSRQGRQRINDLGANAPLQ